MSLRDLFRSAFAVAPQEYDLAEPEAPLVTWGGETKSVIEWMNDTTFIELLPALKRARQMTADTVASLPPVAYRDGVPLDEPPAMVRRPDPSLADDREFVAETMLSLVDYGNCFWWITFDERRNQPIAAKILDPTIVDTVWDSHRNRRHKIAGEFVPERQIRHLAMNRGVNDLIGSGPLQSQRLTGLAYMLQYSSDYFKEASDPSGILTDPFDNDPDEAADKLGQWEDGHDRGTRMLSGGLKWTPNTMTPGDSAWVDSHAASYVDIAVLFGIPPPLLAASLLGGANSIIYQNLTTVYEQWNRDSLSVSWTPLLESAWSSLLPRGTHVELDTDKLLAPDLAGRVGIAADAIAAGFITTDEARAYTGFAGTAAVPIAPSTTGVRTNV
jgi:phage portal protein BeeE